MPAQARVKRQVMLHPAGTRLICSRMTSQVDPQISVTMRKAISVRPRSGAAPVVSLTAAAPITT